MLYRFSVKGAIPITPGRLLESHCCLVTEHILLQSRAVGHWSVLPIQILRIELHLWRGFAGCLIF